MDKIKCLIVDDEVIAQRILTKYLSELSNYEIIATSLNAMEAMQVLQEHAVDLMFLDIEMPKLKGLSFLKTLKNPPAVIITTAHREYALEGFELEVLDYLLKPISFERFFKAVNRYKKHEPAVIDLSTIQEKAEPYLYVKSDRKTLKLLMHEILFIEGLSNYIILHVNNNQHIVYTALGEIQKQLDDNFLRIHKSYIVNKKMIKSYTKEVVSLGNIELPIGKSYKETTNLF